MSRNDDAMTIGKTMCAGFCWETEMSIVGID